MAGSWKGLAGAVALGLAAHGAQAGVIWGDNNHEYQVVAAEGTTWVSAQAAVSAMGSGWHLATITSAAEDSFVSGLLPASSDRSHYWLGATDSAAEGTFAWVTGEIWSHTNWWGGEPNNSTASGMDEDYLAYDLRSGSWAWNDAPDNLGSSYGFARGYVIERTLRAGADVPIPGTLALLALGAGLIGAAARRQHRR